MLAQIILGIISPWLNLEMRYRNMIDSMSLMVSSGIRVTMQVRKISSKEVAETEAYILFYQKAD